MQYEDAQRAAEHYADLAAQIVERTRGDQDRPMWLPEQTCRSAEAYAAVSRAYAACAANALREVPRPVEPEEVDEDFTPVGRVIEGFGDG